MDRRDYDAVVKRVEAVSGVDVHELGEVEGLPVLRVSAGKRDAPVVYINGGTHGDEPAGVEAALAFLEGGWERWADRVRFEVIPCLCPWSYVHSARLNAQDVDVNWAFLRDDVPEIEILKGFLEGQVFCGCDRFTRGLGESGILSVRDVWGSRIPGAGDGDAGGAGLSD